MDPEPTPEPLSNLDLSVILEGFSNQNAKMYALLTACYQDMLPEAEAIIDDAIAEGPESIKVLMAAMTGAAVGSIQAMCEIQQIDPGEFIQLLARGNAMMLVKAQELRDSAEESDTPE